MLVRDFGEVEQLQVTRKGLGDFVSKSDKNSERAIVDELKKARPSFGFVLEEGGIIEGSDKSCRWIVDPLDGTTNFLHGIPHFAISIALEQNGEIVAGVIYDPVKDDLFWAEKGGGAFVNNKRMRVSNRKEMDTAVVATGIPTASRENKEIFLKRLERIMPHVAGVRRMGAAALDLAYVAAGRFDVYFESGCMPWDYAAGILLVKEAGGFVSDHKGGQMMLDSGDIFASNQPLAQSFMKIL
ncbi:MAG: inositol monophosphatase [Alphaproteobacteria bacterium]|nr:inositol monophosphatase [Alphaproteobacteria bacterium]